MIFLIEHIKKNVFVYLLLALFGLLFFYRLDYTTLGSWDEAWYGSIAREIARTGDFMHLVWNGQPFYDHPPLGFWLMAISYKLLGVNEFSTRLPSALLGLLSIIFVYKIGEKLFKKKEIGFAAALVLGTCVWYVIRVRSGNLDSIFVFFYILTIYLSIKSSENFKWFPWTMLSFGALFMSKTLIGITAVPLIVFLNFQQFFKAKNIRYILLGMLAFAFLVFPWYGVQIFRYPGFLKHHFVNIGTRNESFSSYFHISAQQPLYYLHMGVRKWYYIWILGLSFLIVSLKFLKKNTLFLIIWNFIVLYPFLTSSKTELWHLIPVYVPVAFIVSFGVYELMSWLAIILKKIFPFKPLGKKLFSSQIVGLVFILGIFIIAAWQFKVFKNEVFPPNRFIPDDVAISKRAATYNKPIFLDDDYLPIAVFYTNRIVRELRYQDSKRKTLVMLYQNEKRPFVVIVRNWAIDNLKSQGLYYRVLEKNNTFSILSNY